MINTPYKDNKYLLVNLKGASIIFIQKGKSAQRTRHSVFLKAFSIIKLGILSMPSGHVFFILAKFITVP
jgi:hypothetical protein